MSVLSWRIHTFIRTFPVRLDRFAPWNDGRLSFSWYCCGSGDQVRFFNGLEFLDVDCGVVGIGTCTIWGPLRVWRVVASKIRVLVAAPELLSLPIACWSPRKITQFIIHGTVILYFRTEQDNTCVCYVDSMRMGHGFHKVMVVEYVLVMCHNALWIQRYGHQMYLNCTIT